MKAMKKTCACSKKLINHYLATGQMLKNAAGHYRQENNAHAHHQPGGRES